MLAAAPNDAATGPAPLMAGRYEISSPVGQASWRAKARKSGGMMQTTERFPLAPYTMLLDAYDIKLLSLLQRDSKMSQRELSDAVNLSPSAVNRRITALESAGVITSTVAVVDPTSVGRPITILVEVKLENERLDLLDEVKRRFMTCEQVQQCYYVTGDFDFMLILNVKDMSEYERLTRELFFVSGNIKQFKTYVAMQRLKTSMAVPLQVDWAKP